MEKKCVRLKMLWCWWDYQQTRLYKIKKKKISELEDITTETIQNETKKRVFKNEESV